jgi:tetratricopeptide (TPR) repeat protein
MAYYNLGSVLLYSGAVDKAIARFQEALKLEPDHPLVHNKLGDALVRKGEVDQAIAQYQAALRVFPGFTNACSGLGYALLESGQVDAAIVQLEKALALRPNEAKDHNNLGNALLQKGRLREAIAHFEKAIELQPHYGLAENNLAWVLATAPDPALRNGAQAITLAQDADRLAGGQNPIVLATLGAAYAEAGRFIDALAAVQRAMPLAVAQSNAALVDSLKLQSQLYQNASSPQPIFQTNSAVKTNQP